MQLPVGARAGSSQLPPRSCSLEQNSIGNEGVAALALALKVNATVTILW